MPRSIHTIVAGVSQPADTDLTLRMAAELARETGAELHLVLAFTLPPVLSPPELGYVPPEWALQHGEHLRARLETAARRVPGGEAAVCHAVAGPPAPAILETAARQGADLVVIGAARPERLGGLFLGTTAQRVLRGAQAPVLVVRRTLHRPLKRVLLTTDLSELSAAVHEEGLDTATALFGAAGAVRSLLVLPYLIVPSPLPRTAVEHAALQELQQFLQARQARPTAVEPVVREGAPGDEIAAEAAAWDADLLVVGTHRRGWTARLVLGSVAEAAVREAACSVLAIPPRALAVRQQEGSAAAEHPVDTAATGEHALA
jgi:nucleotide-binding universal stress UspA family protein